MTHSTGLLALLPSVSFTFFSVVVFPLRGEWEGEFPALVWSWKLIIIIILLLLYYYSDLDPGERNRPCTPYVHIHMAYLVMIGWLLLLHMWLAR